MRDIMRLAKAGMMPFFGIYSSNRKNRKNSPARKWLIIIAAIAIYLSLILSVFVYEYGMMTSLVMVGAQNVLVSVVIVAASLMGFFAAVFRAGGVLFSFKDYDLLVSLPIPKWKIAASRMLLLYMFDFLFASILMLPAGVLHVMFASPNALFYPMYILAMFTVPMIPLALSALIGTLLMALTRRFKQKNAVTTVLSMLLLIAFMLLSFRSDKLLLEFGEIGEMVLAQMVKMYPPAYLLNAGVVDGSVLSMAVFVAAALLSMYLISVFAAKNMSRLHESFAVSGEATAYKRSENKEASPFMAVYKKEIKRFFSSSVLIMNGAIGVVMFTMAAVALLFFDVETVLAAMELPMMEMRSLYGMLPAAIGFFIAMTSPSACSISLEGKSIGLLKSLPIDTKSILWAKAGVSLTLTVPASIINGAIISFAIDAPIEYAVFIVIIPLLLSVICATAGVMINLKLPSFDWSSEVAVVKQSASTMVMTLLAFVIVAAMIFAGSMINGSILGLLVIAVAELALCAVCVTLMRTWAVRKFEAL